MRAHSVVLRVPTVANPCHASRLVGRQPDKHAGRQTCGEEDKQAGRQACGQANRRLLATWQPCFVFFKRRFIPRQSSHFWDFGDESHESVNHFGKSVLISRLKTTICYLFCIILIKYTFK